MITALIMNIMASLIIGVTGSIGTGKSTVARILKSSGKGVLLLDADKIARRFLRRGSNSAKMVADAFPNSLNKRGKIDPKKLASIVFSNTKRLSSLNNIVHPFVVRAIRQKIEKFPQKVIVLDVPLLVEGDMLGIVDKLILVNAKEELAVKRSGFPKKELEKRRKHQMSFQKKRKEAIKKLGKENVFIIDNSSDKRGVRKKVKEIWQILNQN